MPGFALAPRMAGTSAAAPTCSPTGASTLDRLPAVPRNRRGRSSRSNTSTPATASESTRKPSFRTGKAIRLDLDLVLTALTSEPSPTEHERGAPTVRGTAHDEVAGDARECVGRRPRNVSGEMTLGCACARGLEGAGFVPALLVGASVRHESEGELWLHSGTALAMTSRLIRSLCPSLPTPLTPRRTPRLTPRSNSRSSATLRQPASRLFTDP